MNTTQKTFIPSDANEFKWKVIGTAYRDGILKDTLIVTISSLIGGTFTINAKLVLESNSQIKVFPFDGEPITFERDNVLCSVIRKSK